MEIQPPSSRSPGRDLMHLLLYSLLCTVVFQLGIVLLGAVFTGDISSVVSGNNSLLKTNSLFAYSLFASGSIGTFLLPTLFLQRGNRQTSFYNMERISDWKNYLLGAIFLIAFMPCMNLIAEWNIQMKLPETLKSVEEWMREKEDSAIEITADLIMISSLDKLLLNLLIIAILPGIAEEFFFRGALQNIFRRLLGNPHLAIWVVGIIFSAIHMQFYGFFPRMILGVFLGYLVFWTGNIWVSAFVHFLNNAGVVVLAFYYTRQGKSYAEFVEDSISYSIIAYLGSLILSGILAYVIYQYTQKKKLYGKRLD